MRLDRVLLEDSPFSVDLAVRKETNTIRVIPIIHISRFAVRDQLVCSGAINMCFDKGSEYLLTVSGGILLA